MSLSYHSEHLAWQQRVGQERTRADNFYKTTGSFFYSPAPSSRSPFPNSNQDIEPKNYKTLDFSLAYTFGGTKPIKNAFLEPAKIEQLKAQRPISSRSAHDLKKRKVYANKHNKKYINELKQQIDSERLKREAVQKQIKLLKK
ncbi:hypothetical protein SteCoe_14891 [Stentor coeruleus]|uniref:Uncharacterized protein n=1 Tax=Stentor coeruleus TaxID=5963 RepID=A0A1R2C4X3_9CILI|nr:hypothetical protein SteCoe_14891 [Stentor coeruleus]